MARTFRRHRQAHPIAELNLTNLIDLGFTLLIIFMIATPLINQEQTMPVNLPVETKRLQDKPDKETRFFSISIDAKGNYYFDNVRNSVNAKELSARLKSISAQAKPPVIRIRADAEVPYKKVISLMDEIKKYNLSRVTFDTQSEG